MQKTGFLSLQSAWICVLDRHLASARVAFLLLLLLLLLRSLLFPFLCQHNFCQLIKIILSNFLPFTFHPPCLSLIGTVCLFYPKQ
ncbi:hypothetical protein T4E_167 [Trichinella pseudospiralis]|uniref:Uncharacterized protein n=1 Tax=Trichinella pseudospiralis TaxID=6337 RepID=A0A0V0XYM2_TRIPS|nr:hypothetical protein T4E_167 [Trichinella pseudospiralis]